jgi:hypothetical protein
MPILGLAAAATPTVSPPPMAAATSMSRTVVGEEASQLISPDAP